MQTMATPTPPTNASELSHRLPLGWLKSTGILLGLIGLGWYGHESHWTLPFVAHGPDHHSTQHPFPKKSHSIDVRQLANGELEFASTESLRVIGLTTETVRQDRIAEEIPAHGIISYDHRYLARLSSRVPGIVWRVDKFLGDSVQKGDVLAIIEAVQIGNAKADFLSALAVSEVRTEQRRRLDGLTDLISQRILREAILAEREALVRLRNTEQTLINLGLPIRSQDYVDLNDEERSARIQFAGLPPEIVATLEARQTTSSLVPMTAPFDGQIISRDMALGEVVHPDETLFEIADTSRMWLLLDIGKEAAHAVHPGQLVKFAADGVEEQIPATIDWISTEVDEKTRTLQVRAQIDHSLFAGDSRRRRLHANTFGTARIQVRESSHSLVVPRGCVQSDRDQSVVFLRVDERRFRLVPVSCGITSDDHVEITGGIALGAVIVREGSHVLKSQMVLSRMAMAGP